MMTKWTSEQLQAINEDGKNIIVSAGAGSGKTAVLTERVITKLKNGVNINELLILTFTNAAACEMKERIRDAIIKDSSLEKQLDYIDSSYITTFDSFSMALLKKYHHLVNVSKHISIIESSICDNLRKEILSDILNDLYEKENINFLKLVDDLCLKDDHNIRTSIIDINTKLDRLINKENYLNNYINDYYSEENIDKLINIFMNILYSKIKHIEDELYLISDNVDSDYYEKISNVLLPLINSHSYESIKVSLDIKVPNLPKGCDDSVKLSKTKISSIIKEIKSLTIYHDDKHLKDTLLSTKVYANAIIDIIKKLDVKLNEYKKQYDIYEYSDIAIKVIDLVNNNETVRNEITNSFKEILVDEYQDTSDIQEALLSKISNNNLYMVGDIKQSIYRFRNANPDIFKMKYEEYNKLNGGIKIDLLKNFRSRGEVLDDINHIFDEIMTSNIGGADYKISHQMVFGNTMYTDNHPNQNFNLEVYNYQRNNKRYSTAEYEAFIIANDIKNKIVNKFQVIDKDTKKTRSISFGDFCIILDRKSNFELYKKIFEFMEIPLVIYFDEKINNEKDILILKNIIDIIVKIYDHNFDTEFKYEYYSIARSYIGNLTDQDFVDIYLNNNYKDSIIYEKCLKIAKKLDSITSYQLIEMIIEEFDFTTNSISIGDIEKHFIRFDYIKDLANNLTNLSYTPIEFNEYLKEMIMSDSDITFSLNTKVSNNVRLMNIHKSKGLEFPVCYFAGFNAKFNLMELNNPMNFDQSLGLILPFFDEGVGPTIMKSIYKDKYLMEDISERIRLLYVALTRAKEKMIIVANLSDKETYIDDNIRLEYRSFLNILESIKKDINKCIINIDNVNLSKAYNISKDKILDFNSSEEITVNEININNNSIENNQVSKHINSLIDRKEYEALQYGNVKHQLLESENFLTSDVPFIKLFVQKLEDINNCKIYKEHEFIYQDNDIEYHGIIDLILEYNNEIKIIDYKLKNIDDNNYLKQLSLYKKYVSTITNKSIKCYLYSILQNELREIKED